MKKYKINKGFIIQKLGKKAVIFDGEKSVLFTFNETATFIFQKIKLGWEKKRIIDSVAKSFSVKRETAQRDITKLIYELKAKKIIV